MAIDKDNAYMVNNYYQILFGWCRLLTGVGSPITAVGCPLPVFGYPLSVGGRSLLGFRLTAF